MNELLEDKADLQLQIIFDTVQGVKDKTYQVANHLLAIKETGDELLVKKALHSWYARQYPDYETWARDFPISNAANAHDSLSRQQQWCSLAEVEWTPTVLLNGRKLPEFYQVEDIKYFI